VPPARAFRAGDVCWPKPGRAERSCPNGIARARRLAWRGDGGTGYRSEGGIFDAPRSPGRQPRTLAPLSAAVLKARQPRRVGCRRPVASAGWQSYVTSMPHRRPPLQQLRRLLACLALALAFQAPAGLLEQPLRAVASLSMSVAAGSAVTLGRGVDARGPEARQGATASAPSAAVCLMPTAACPAALASGALLSSIRRERPFRAGHLYLDNCSLLC
jgi:hypothetical protein